jgi:hypothetical protein
MRVLLPPGLVSRRSKPEDSLSTEGAAPYDLIIKLGSYGGGQRVNRQPARIR